MIAVDTSALMAIILEEPEAASCMKAIAFEPVVLISAGTLAEAFIVAGGRDLTDQMETLVGRLSLEVVSVSHDGARSAAAAHRKWGRGRHSAKLNFGDCFAYALAKDRNCPLLFIGQDFAQTDLEPVLKHN